MTITFKKAVKHESKARIALIGPAGSGKSMTMLIAARALVGPAGKIAAVDTEHGSLSKYAGEPIPGQPGQVFDFDVLELDSFSPDNFMQALKLAEAGGYDAFCCDSLSHFWVGKDGALEFVDMAAKRYKDGMGGWKEFRPHERAMVDAMVASPCHVFVTMRTKTEYQEQVNPNTGKKQRIKIGLQPVQRDGLEYEFDLVGYMDDENNLVIDKTRCPSYSEKVFKKPSAKEFAAFGEWLKGAARALAITRQQAEELHASARAKGIGNEKLLQLLGITRLGDLHPDQLEKAKAIIAAQPAPGASTEQEIGKAYDAEIEHYVRAGISMDVLHEYVQTLPFARDLAKVANNLRQTRECHKPEFLSATIQSAIQKAKGAKS